MGVKPIALALVALCYVVTGFAQAPTVPQTHAAPEESIARTSGAATNIRSEVAKALADFRREAIHKLVSDPRAPLDSARLFGLRYFAYNDSFDLTAVFRPSEDTSLISFPTSDGKARDYRTYGQLLFHVGDSTYSLDVFELPGLERHPIYFDHLFLPFFDLSNGESTYGGGRYLDLKRSDFVAGNFALDFNKAYNPWCAYATGYSCPVPPLSNALPIAIHAGEAAYVKQDGDGETPRTN